MNAHTRGAAIVGWGKCLPPATLTNADIATILGISRKALWEKRRRYGIR